MYHLVDSCKMSFFKRSSMASRFSARSDNDKVFLGSAESRKTNGLPDMYTREKGERKCHQHNEWDV